ncbi:hypothetical protein BYT27DRAFT_6338164 [Phlegmacium glaucopus]|nr:hypothetical protein BYT27DRAFT_6338164 [Phlegmacium glaucopus]
MNLFWKRFRFPSFGEITCAQVKNIDTSKFLLFKCLVQHNYTIVCTPKDFSSSLSHYRLPFWDLVSKTQTFLRDIC